MNLTFYTKINNLYWFDLSFPAQPTGKTCEFSNKTSISGFSRTTTIYKFGLKIQTLFQKGVTNLNKLEKNEVFLINSLKN